MATSTQENNSESTPAGPTVPNFREDERLQARYASMIERRIKTFGLEHESSIRRNASSKRDELRDELNEAQADYDARKEAAEAAREEYRKAYPHHVKRTRLSEPSVIENMKSLGSASKIYRAAEEAWRAAETAASNVRRIEHNEEQLEIELKKALERAPAVIKDVTESEKWLAEIHAEEELANVKSKLDEIAVERESYANRLAAGTVTDEERRLRAFGEQDIKPLQFPIERMMFYRIDQFGPKNYFVVRDARKALFALPYDRRLEPLVDGVYDVVRLGKDFGVRPSTRDNSRAPFLLLDHFLKCNENQEEAAQEAYRAHQEFVRQPRVLQSMTELSDTEAGVIALLAEYAAAKGR